MTAPWFPQAACLLRRLWQAGRIYAHVVKDVARQAGHDSPCLLEVGFLWASVQHEHLWGAHCKALSMMH